MIDRIKKLLGRNKPKPVIRDLGTAMKDYYLTMAWMRGKYTFPGPYSMCVYTTGWGKVMFSADGLTEHDVYCIHMISQKRPCYVRYSNYYAKSDFGQDINLDNLKRAAIIEGRSVSA